MLSVEWCYLLLKADGWRQLKSQPWLTGQRKSLWIHGFLINGGRCRCRVQQWVAALVAVQILTRSANLLMTRAFTRTLEAMSEQVIANHAHWAFLVYVLRDCPHQQKNHGLEAAIVQHQASTGEHYKETEPLTHLLTSIYLLVYLQSCFGIRWNFS